MYWKILPLPNKFILIGINFLQKQTNDEIILFWRIGRKKYSFTKFFFKVPDTDLVGLYDKIDFENLKKVYRYHQQGIQNIQEHNIRIFNLNS